MICGFIFVVYDYHWWSIALLVTSPWFVMNYNMLSWHHHVSVAERWWWTTGSDVFPSKKLGRTNLKHETRRTPLIQEIPSGKLTVCYWKLPFTVDLITYWKWWFSIVMLVYQRVNGPWHLFSFSALQSYDRRGSFCSSSRPLRPAAS